MGSESSWRRPTESTFLCTLPQRTHHILYIHLGLIGKLRFEPREETAGQIRVRIDNGTEAANLRGPQFCRLLTEEEYRTQLAKVGQDPLRADADVEALWAKVHGNPLSPRPLPFPARPRRFP